MECGEGDQDCKARPARHGELPSPRIKPGAPRHQVAQPMQGGGVEVGLRAGHTVQPAAEKLPFDVDHRKGEAATQHAGEQAHMADDASQELDGGIGFGKRVGGANDHEIGERCDHDGVEAQQHGRFGIERGQHDTEAIPGPHPRLLLGRSLGLDARDRERLARHVHPRSALMLAAYRLGPPLNTAVPATRTSAPALIQRRAVSGLTPPSTSRSIALPKASIALRRAAILVSWLSMNAWPPKPGLTLITSTRSRSPSTCSTAASGVAGLSTAPAFLPKLLM